MQKDHDTPLELEKEEQTTHQEEGQVNNVPVNVSSCRVEQVTIYNDRAEVTRLVSLADLPPGTTEVSVVGLSAKVDRNSVRVSGAKGEATILEVSYNSRWQAKNKDDGTERSSLQRELEKLAEQIARQEEALARIAKENAWVEQWARTLIDPAAKAKGSAAGGPAELFSAQAMEQAMSFMHFYQKSLADIDQRRAGVNAALKELREEHDRATKTLGALTSSVSSEEVHEITVLLDVEASGPLELLLAYVVMGASWQAAYDVRVKSNDAKLNLTYYGIITNNSLDHWHDAPLALSTAQPSVGGAPPDLPTKFVGFVQPTYHMRGGHSPWASYSNAAVYQDDISSAQKVFDFQAEKLSEKSERSAVQVMTTDVKESSICTSFEIPRRTTILSDNKPHKVTIRIIKLKAKFTYVLIPKLSTHAYLKASIVNDSDKYAFLAGDMNVFMDGNFVAKSAIKAVSPSESFALFLGIDDSIKMTYPPGVFFNDTQGYLRKSNLKTVKHLITIKNTKATDVHVAVFDQLPKSNDGQIKVRLLKPVLSETEAVALTVANNLKWKLDIKPGKQIQLPFEYQLEWPLGQEINI